MARNDLWGYINSKLDNFRNQVANNVVRTAQQAPQQIQHAIQPVQNFFTPQAAQQRGQAVGNFLQQDVYKPIQSFTQQQVQRPIEQFSQNISQFKFPTSYTEGGKTIQGGPPLAQKAVQPTAKFVFNIAHPIKAYQQADYKYNEPERLLQAKKITPEEYRKRTTDRAMQMVVAGGIGNDTSVLGGKSSILAAEDFAKTTIGKSFQKAITSGNLEKAQVILDKLPETNKAVPALQGQLQKMIKGDVGTSPLLSPTEGGVPPTGTNMGRGSGVGEGLPGDTRKVLSGEGDLKQRGFTTTVQESEKSSKALQKAVSGDYVVKPGAVLKKQAVDLIRQNPQAAEQMIFDETANIHPDVRVQMGNELIHYYDSIGDIESAKALSNQLAVSGTELGRGVQAFANYDKTSPAGALRFAQSKINEFNRLNPNKRLEISDEQVKSIFDTAHAIQEMPMGRERNIAANELINQVNDLIPSSIGDKAITVWKAGLLTSLRTHERNLLGNTLHQGAEIAKDYPASVADRVMALRTGERTLTPTTQGLWQGTKKGLQSAKDIIETGYDPEDAISKYDVRHVTWGNNKFEQGMKAYTELVFRTLGGADKPFWNAAYARSLYDQAGAEAVNAGVKGDRAYIEALVQEPTEQMLTNALKDANVATFHNVNPLGKGAQLIKGVYKYIPGDSAVARIGRELTKTGGEVVAPFTGVPTSIAGQMFNYSPLGLIKGAITTGEVLVNNVPELQRQAAQEVGRGVMGTALFGLGAYLMKKGLMTGQPKDQAEARQWELENKPRNSVMVNGKWRSINSIGPELIVVLAGAKAQEELNKGKEGSAGKYAAGIGQDFLSQTFLQGVQQPLQALSDPARYGPSYLGNQTASIIPNIIKDAGRSTDPYQRENSAFGDYFQNSLPGLRNLNTPRRTVLGNPIPQEPTGPAAFVDLLNSKTPIHTTVVDELSRLNTVGSNATPSKLNKNQTIQGQKMTLTPEQLNSLEAQSGPQVTQALQQLIQSPAYQGLDDVQKSEAISDTVTSIRKQVRGSADVNAPAPLPTPSPQGAAPKHAISPDGMVDFSVSAQEPASAKSPTSTGAASFAGNSVSIIDETGNVRRIDLAQYQGSGPDSPILNAKWKEQKLSTASSIYFSNLSDSDKKSAISKMGLSYNETEYRAIKSLKDADQAVIVADLIKNKGTGTLDGLIDREVLTTGITNQMAKQGIISWDQKASLDNYIKGRSVSTGKAKGGKGKKISIPKVSAVKVSKGKSVKVSMPKLKSLKVKSIKASRAKVSTPKAATLSFKTPPLPKLRSLQG